MICVVESCSGRVVAKELCDKHRKRLAKHGHLQSTRPRDWGLREKHPLYHSWSWMRRAKAPVSSSWEDFWAFVDDVGGRPEGCNLRRIDESKPYGPHNFYWKEKIVSSDRNEYARSWRAANPLKTKRHDLKRQYGISLDQYMQVLEKQDGVCAICSGPQTDRYEYLSVDHDHATGTVRGLLCSSCNIALGGFKDSPDVLANAQAYLLKHRN